MSRLFGDSLSDALKRTYSGDQHMKWKDLLHIIKHETGDYIDIYFIGDQSYITTKQAQIHPLYIKAHNPNKPTKFELAKDRKPYVYRYDTLKRIIHDRNPIYNDIKTYLGYDRKHKIVSGINLFRIYTGSTTQFMGRPSVRARLAEPDQNIAGQLLDKYGNINDLTRPNIYKLNAFFRNCIQSKAIATINRFKRLAINRLKFRKLKLCYNVSYYSIQL
jgi:hypothetical protein